MVCIQNKKTMKQGSKIGALGLIGSAIVASVIIFNPADQKIDLQSNKVQALILHCSATREGQKNMNAKVVDAWHTAPPPVGKNERVNPYNIIVDYNGHKEIFRPWNGDSIVNRFEVSWGSASYNICSYNICYVGGMNREYTRAKNTLTADQDSSLKEIVFDFLHQYPNGYIMGHNQIFAKACPSFDVRQKCLSWGVPIHNIWKINKQYVIPEKYGKVIFVEK